MKKLALVFTILCGLVAGTIPALAQTNGTNTNYCNAAFAADANGRVLASEYGKWQITTLTPILRGAPDGRLNFALTKPHIVNPLACAAPLCMIIHIHRGKGGPDVGGCPQCPESLRQMRHCSVQSVR